MEEKTFKREEDKEPSPEEQKDISELAAIREQEYEQAGNRLRRFQQQYWPDYTTNVGAEKRTFKLDEHGYQYLSKTEPMSPQEMKEMEEVKMISRKYWDFKYDAKKTEAKDVSPDRDEPER